MSASDPKKSAFSVLVETLTDEELAVWLEMCLQLGTTGMQGYEATAAEMVRQGRPRRSTPMPSSDSSPTRASLPAKPMRSRRTALPHVSSLWLLVWFLLGLLFCLPWAEVLAATHTAMEPLMEVWHSFV